MPAFSNHPASTFASLQLGGAIRCERRNRLPSDYAASIRSFKRRLKDRGFDLAGFDRLLARYRAKRMRRHAAPGLVRKAVLKLPYNKDISASWVSQKLRQFEPLLRQSVPALKRTTSWIGRSLFQSRYKQVWKLLV